MTIIYLVLVFFTPIEFNWGFLILAVIVDSIAYNSRRNELEEKVRQGEADDDEIDDYMDNYDGDEDMVEEGKENRRY